MRRSSVPFGMNSPKPISTPTSEMSQTRFSRFRAGGLSPNYEMMKTEYNSIKGLSEKSNIPFSSDERKFSGL
jgi:hypothetical protein